MLKADVLDSASAAMLAMELKPSFSGELLLPGDAGYDAARTMARVPDDATAFPNRNHNWWLNFALHWDEESRDEDCVGQIRRAHDALRPWLSSGIYANMLNFDEADRLLDAYGGPERYARLGRVKAAYDPDNFFRVNANIQPRP